MHQPTMVSYMLATQQRMKFTFMPHLHLYPHMDCHGYQRERSEATLSFGNAYQGLTFAVLSFFFFFEKGLHIPQAHFEFINKLKLPWNSWSFLPPLPRGLGLQIYVTTPSNNNNNNNIVIVTLCLSHQGQAFHPWQLASDPAVSRKKIRQVPNKAMLANKKECIFSLLSKGIVRGFPKQLERTRNSLYARNIFHHVATTAQVHSWFVKSIFAAFSHCIYSGLGIFFPVSELIPLSLYPYVSWL